MSIYEQFVGKYVLCRSRNEGLNAGFVVAADETGVVLRDCRRLWYHKPLKEGACWYEAIANSGVSKDSRLSEIVEKKLIVEGYSLTLCTESSAENIQEAKSHEN